MKFITINNIAQLTDKLSEESVQAYSKFIRHSGRISLYVWPLASILWLYIVFPDIGFPEKQNLIELGYVWVYVVATIFLHEFIHLIALPHKIFHPDTSVIFNNAGSILHKSVAIKFGGKLTRNQFIWTSILPFIVLSIIPFSIAIFAEQKPSLAIGMAAAANVSFSVIDIIQAALLMRYVPANQVFGE